MAFLSLTLISHWTLRHACPSLFLFGMPTGEEEQRQQQRQAASRARLGRLLQLVFTAETQLKQVGRMASISRMTIPLSLSCSGPAACPAHSCLCCAFLLSSSQSAAARAEAILAASPRGLPSSSSPYTNGTGPGALGSAKQGSPLSPSQLALLAGASKEGSPVSPGIHGVTSQVKKRLG